MKEEKEVFWPKTFEELNDYMVQVAKEAKDYNGAVQAMSLAACAAMNLMATEMVVATGMQVSLASVDVVKRMSHIKGPFIVLPLEKGLYPQYNLFNNLAEFIVENQSWLKENAQKLLNEHEATKHEKFPANPDVVAHWEKIIKL